MSTQDGFRNALNIFRRSAHDIVAYRRFLEAHHIKPSSIRSAKDWDTVPQMGKKEYLSRYPLQEFFPKGRIPPMIYASSGSSGHPTFWFRGVRQEGSGADAHERIFRDMFGLKKEDATLVVICFSTGIWVAGNYTLVCCRELAKRGYSIASVTPGIEMEDIMNTLATMAPHFKHVILAGYPPFLMDVVNEAQKRKIPLRQNLKFITAGDKFTEEWRDSLLKLVGTHDPLRSIASIYGSADAGVLGYETPVSILLRREALVNKEFGRALFGEEAVQPALVQYDPEQIFFEEKNGELLFTTDTATPLIRYNIHDVGRVIPWETMRVMLRSFGLEKKAIKLAGRQFALPFVVKGGRNDVAVTFYALNIYPENIKDGLGDRAVRRFVSGQFFAFNRNRDHEKKQELCINVELAEGVKTGKKTMERVREAIVDTLIQENIEYRKLHAALGAKALPKIKTVPYGGKGFYEHGVRGLVSAKGKKMKMLDATP